MDFSQRDREKSNIWGYINFSITFSTIMIITCTGGEVMDLKMTNKVAICLKKNILFANETEPKV